MRVLAALGVALALIGCTAARPVPEKLFVKVTETPGPATTFLDGIPERPLRVEVAWLPDPSEVAAGDPALSERALSYASYVVARGNSVTSFVGDGSEKRGGSPLPGFHLVVQGSRGGERPAVDVDAAYVQRERKVRAAKARVAPGEEWTTVRLARLDP